MFVIVCNTLPSVKRNVVRVFVLFLPSFPYLSVLFFHTFYVSIIFFCFFVPLCFSLSSSYLHFVSATQLCYYATLAWILSNKVDYGAWSCVVKRIHMYVTVVNSTARSRPFLLTGWHAARSASLVVTAGSIYPAKDPQNLQFLQISLQHAVVLLQRPKFCWLSRCT
jgi:hypothetical protein